MHEFVEYIIAFLIVLGFIICYAYGDIYAVIYITISYAVLIYINRRTIKKIILLITRTIENEKEN